MQRRDAGLWAMKGHPIFQRRACVLIGVDPKTVRRERPPDSPEIREEMHKIAKKRRRVGYWRMGIMPERKGMGMIEKGSSTTLIGRRACQCAAGVGASGLVEAGHRCRCGQASAGRPTSCPTPWEPAASSAFLR